MFRIREATREDNDALLQLEAQSPQGTGVSIIIDRDDYFYRSQLHEDSRILIAEDVLTTGRSVKEVIALLGQDGIVPVGVAGLVNRSRSPIDFGGIKCESLIKLDIPTFEEGACPLCQEGMPLIKPGSRK